MSEHRCTNCKERTTEIGHMCNPLKNVNIYECMGCGIISTDKELLCKPRPLKLVDKP